MRVEADGGGEPVPIAVTKLFGFDKPKRRTWNRLCLSWDAHPVSVTRNRVHIARGGVRNGGYFETVRYASGGDLRRAHSAIGRGRCKFDKMISCEGSRFHWFGITLFRQRRSRIDRGLWGCRERSVGVTVSSTYVKPWTKFQGSPSVSARCWVLMSYVLQERMYQLYFRQTRMLMSCNNEGDIGLNDADVLFPLLSADDGCIWVQLWHWAGENFVTHIMVEKANLNRRFFGPEIFIPSIRLFWSVRGILLKPANHQVPFHRVLQPGWGFYHYLQQSIRMLIAILFYFSSVLLSGFIAHSSCTVYIFVEEMCEWSGTKTTNC